MPQKKRRPNPIHLSMGDAIASVAADLTVTARLYDWTRNEKLMLAAMLPEIRRTIRTISPDQLAKLVAGPTVNISVKGKVLRT